MEDIAERVYTVQVQRNNCSILCEGWFAFSSKDPNLTCLVNQAFHHTCPNRFQLPADGRSHLQGHRDFYKAKHRAEGCCSPADVFAQPIRPQGAIMVHYKAGLYYVVLSCLIYLILFGLILCHSKCCIS